ncbi:MAG: exodeoxyribonuclease VII large subunit [Deltaproteobacteria bacterium]|nr:exodeoxyribonuclease VII large subunit [Deltaproteobacteria bacterium]
MKQDDFGFDRVEEITPTPRILSITELTFQLRDVLEAGFSDVWIVGEVSNFRNRTSRHWYFSLKDQQSQISAVIFNAASLKLPFDLADGQEVICHGRLNVYPPRGNYSIIIDHIEPKGVGALQLAFEQLKKKLEAEGLFDKKYKKPLPFLPQKIGVVTSPTGAAVRDIINVLTRRFPGVGILVAPVKVQGEGAAEEIAQAITELNMCGDIDLLIVGRGGGSMEDLWEFNEEIVARAIFASRIPVISAVGHEIDFTIADFVADVRAPTPSAAAEIAVPVQEELKVAIHNYRRQLLLALRQAYVNRMSRVKELRGRMKDPRSRFPDFLLRIDSYRERLNNAVDVTLERKQNLFAKLLSNLNHLSPLHILAKGYSVVQRAGTNEVIRNATTLQAGDNVLLLFSEGSAEAKVIKAIS